MLAMQKKNIFTQKLLNDQPTKIYYEYFYMRVIKTKIHSFFVCWTKTKK